MAAKDSKLLLQRAWREQWKIENWLLEVNKVRQNYCSDNLGLECLRRCLAEGLLQYAISSPTAGAIFLSYVKDALIAEQFTVVDILDYICKINVCGGLKQYDIALKVFEDTIECIRKTYDEDESLDLAICLARCICWLFGTIADVNKNAMLAANSGPIKTDTQDHFSISEKCFELVRRLMDTPALLHLVLIGKLELQAEQDTALQTKLNDVMSIQPDVCTDQAVILQCQSNLKELMNNVARFHNSTLTGVMSQSRKPGHVPSYTLQTLIEIQVIDNFAMDSTLMADLFNTVLRSENIPMDQFYVDLMRCGFHGILMAANPQEELFWSSFVFFKIPTIVNCLRFKYQQNGLDNTIFFTACKQFAQMNILLDDLDVYCRLQCLPNFLSQCQNKGLLDANAIDSIMSHCVPAEDAIDSAITAGADRNPVGSVLSAARTVADIMQVLTLPWEENKDVIRQQLTQLTNISDLGKILATAAGMDKLSVCIDQLISLNEQTKGPVSEPNEEPLFAEVRADIFNCTFLLLSYLTALFGVKVLSNASNKDAFFVTWRLNCSADVGQKRYSPMALDMILEQVMASSLPSINAMLAKWDDYCLCSGAVIKELTQALASGVIVVDKIQKVCETFKNKRPALCICASSWLCTQHNSMIAAKRDMTIKILRAFRGHGAQKTARSEFMAKIIEDLAGSIGLEQQNMPKGKQAAKGDQTGRCINESQNTKQTLQDMIKLPGSPKIDKKSLNDLKRQIKFLSPTGFCDVLVKTIVNSGKIDEAKSFEILSSTLILLDPQTLVPALLGETMPSLIRRSDASNLLSDPQGNSLAKFISKAVAYSLIYSETKLDDEQRPQKMAKFEVDPDAVLNTEDKIIKNLCSFLEYLLDALHWQQLGSHAVFMKSLLEQLCTLTMHLTRPLKLPADLSERLLNALPDNPSSEILVFLCNTDDTDKRKQFAHRICRNLNRSVNI